MSARVHECCPTCICGRRAPVQGSDGAIPRGQPGHGPGTIAWTEHELAWSAYAQKYGRDQSAEVIAQRGGFGYRELQIFLGRDPETWAPVRGAT